MKLLPAMQQILSNSADCFDERCLEEKKKCVKWFLSLNEQQQVDFVQDLLSVMCHYQHGQIEAFLKPMLQRDFISALPGNDMILYRRF